MDFLLRLLDPELAAIERNKRLAEEAAARQASQQILSGIGKDTVILSSKAETGTPASRPKSLSDLWSGTFKRIVKKQGVPIPESAEETVSIASDLARRNNVPVTPELENALQSVAQLAMARELPVPQTTNEIMEMVAALAISQNVPVPTTPDEAIAILSQVASQKGIPLASSLDGLVTQASDLARVHQIPVTPEIERSLRRFVQQVQEGKISKPRTRSEAIRLAAEIAVHQGVPVPKTAEESLRLVTVLAKQQGINLPDTLDGLIAQASGLARTNNIPITAKAEEALQALAQMAKAGDLFDPKNINEVMQLATVLAVSQKIPVPATPDEALELVYKTAWNNGVHLPDSMDLAMAKTNVLSKVGTIPATSEIHASLRFFSQLAEKNNLPAPKTMEDAGRMAAKLAFLEGHPVPNSREETFLFISRLAERQGIVVPDTLGVAMAQAAELAKANPMPVTPQTLENLDFFTKLAEKNYLPPPRTLDEAFTMTARLAFKQSHPIPGSIDETIQYVIKLADQQGISVPDSLESVLIETMDQINTPPLPRITDTEEVLRFFADWAKVNKLETIPETLDKAYEMAARVVFAVNGVIPKSREELMAMALQLARQQGVTVPDTLEGVIAMARANQIPLSAEVEEAILVFTRLAEAGQLELPKNRTQALKLAADIAKSLGFPVPTTVDEALPIVSSVAVHHGVELPGSVDGLISKTVGIASARQIPITPETEMTLRAFADQVAKEGPDVLKNREKLLQLGAEVAGNQGLPVPKTADEAVALVAMLADMQGIKISDIVDGAAQFARVHQVPISSDVENALKAVVALAENGELGVPGSMDEVTQVALTVLAHSKGQNAPTTLREVAKLLVAYKPDFDAKTVLGYKSTDVSASTGMGKLVKELPEGTSRRFRWIPGLSSLETEALEALDRMPQPVSTSNTLVELVQQICNDPTRAQELLSKFEMHTDLAMLTETRTPLLIDMLKSAEFRAGGAHERIAQVLGQLSVGAGKAAQIGASSEDISPELREVFRVLQSKGAPTRTLEEAQAFSDLAFGEGKYRIKKLAGVGTVGETYFAQEMANQNEVMIKMIKEGVSLETLEAECRLVKEIIQHMVPPGIKQKLLLRQAENLYTMWKREVNFIYEALGAFNLAKKATRYKVAKPLLLGFVPGNEGAVAMVLEKASGVPMDKLVKMLTFYNENPVQYAAEFRADIEKFPWLSDPEIWKNQLPDVFRDGVNEMNLLRMQKGQIAVTHGDLHGGNYFVDFDDATKTLQGTFIDTGLTVPRTSRQVISNMSTFVNMMTGNAKAFAENIIDTAEMVPEHLSREELVKQLAENLDKHLFRAKVNVTNLKDNGRVVNSVLLEMGILISMEETCFLQAQGKALLAYEQLCTLVGRKGSFLVDSIPDIWKGLGNILLNEPGSALKQFGRTGQFAITDSGQAIRTLLQFLNQAKAVL